MTLREPASGPNRKRGGEDGGSATVWVLAASLAVLLFAFLILARTTAVLARHRAQGAADLAALAAAAQIGISEDSCNAAEFIARKNHAEVRDCAMDLAADGRSGTVRVQVALTVTIGLGVGPQTVTAAARAARLPSQGSLAGEGRGRAA